MMATDNVTFTLTGAEAVQRRLRTFAPKLQRKALRAAARSAMKIVQQAARANAKRIDDPDTGNQIWREIKIQAGKMREPGVIMRVGVAGGAVSAKSKTPPWYWRLIELGTEHTRAQPFLRPALENNVQSVASKFISELNVQIDKLPAGP
jgi:HK97 gp10 family phage protein